MKLDSGNHRRRTGREAVGVVVTATVESSAAVQRVPHDIKALERDVAVSHNDARSELCSVVVDVFGL